VVFLDATTDPGLLDASPGLAEWAGHQAAMSGEPHFVLRRQRPYFLLGPGDRRLPDLPSATRWATAEGIPVFRRIGGGSLVYLDEGCLSFAHAIPCRDMAMSAGNFRQLTRPVLEGLRALGVEASFGRVAGSYCEGPWDLVAGKRKIAGTAQAIRDGFALVSGMLLVTQDGADATRRVNDFYERAKGGRPFDPGAVTSLHALSRGTVTMEALALAIQACLGSTKRSSFDEEDRSFVRRTLLERRLV